VLTHCERTIGGNEKSSEVLAILAPRDEVRAHLDRCDRVGVDPAVIEAEGSVLANSSDLLGLRSAPRLLLDIGHSATNVTLLIGGAPVMLRSISVAGRHLSDALATELGLDPAAAEKHKHENGIFQPGTCQPVCSRIALLLDQLARETLRSVQSVVADALDPSAPSEILLGGGSASLPGLAAYFQERTRIPVRVVAPPSDAVGGGTWLTELRPELYLQAVALAARGAQQRPLTRATFRQGEMRYTADLSALRGDLQRVAFLFAVLLALWPLTHVAEWIAVSQRSSALQGEIGQLYGQALPGEKMPADPMKGLEQQWNDTQQLADHLGVTGGGSSPLELLREISEKIAPQLDISLIELSIERYTIRARGIAPDFSTTDLVRAELAKVPQFKEVSISNVQQRPQQTGYSFDLLIDMKGEGL